MPIELTVSFDTREADKVLGELIARAKDLTPAFRVIGENVLFSIEKNFAAQGRPEKWAPLSPATIDERMGRYRGFGAFKKSGELKSGAARKFANMLILTRTGRLRRSLTYRAEPMRCVIGTNLIYSAIHQFGGKAGRGHKVTIPARPFLVMQAEDIAMVEKEIRDFLETEK